MEKDKILIVSEAELKRLIRETLFEKEKENYYNRFFDKKEVNKMLNLSQYQINKMVKKGILESPVKGKVSGKSLFNYLNR